MKAINHRASRSLEHLYAILGAGQSGYAVAAANLNNRALKLLFKTYARQRADFKRDLQATAGNRIARPHWLVDLIAMIHRGRINIFAALTIGEPNRENVVLKEVLVGEEATLRAYERVLRIPLPDDTQQLVQEEYQQVQRLVEQVRLMRGESGMQRVIRLFDSQRDAARAMQLLRLADFDSDAMETVAVDEAMRSHQEHTDSRLLETIVSGATGGAMWGSASGALAGLGVLNLPGLGFQQASVAVQELVWAETALAAIFCGAFVGAVLGTFIGWGVQGADDYLYNESQQHGQVLLRLQTKPSRAAEAARIMAQVNSEARMHPRHVLA